MLERVIGILKLDIATYEEVEHDPDALKQAAMIVGLAALLGAIGQAFAAEGNAAGNFVGHLLGSFVGWFISAWVTLKVGVGLFKGEADMGEMLRVLGFAQAPLMLYVLTPIPVAGPLIALVGAIWSLVTYFIAIRQGLDISNGQTVATIVIVVLVYMAVILGIALVIGLLAAMLIGGLAAVS